jgi:hypothetical protein
MRKTEILFQDIHSPEYKAGILVPEAVDALCSCYVAGYQLYEAHPSGQMVSILAQ